MAGPEITIEFFHDCLSAWCYPASPRLRNLVKEHPNINVIQRAFPMATSADLFTHLFDSPEAAKKEVVQDHWAEARDFENDQRINCELMMSRNFPYPYSMPNALGAKAAELLGGQSAHWDFFDRVQQAHLTECNNIADFQVLYDCAHDIGLDADAWQKAVKTKQVHDMLQEDMKVAENYGISRNPALVANGKFHLPGDPKSIFGYSISVDALELWYQDVIRRLEIGYQLPDYPTQ